MEDAVEHAAEGVSLVEIGPKVQTYWDAYAKVAGVTAPFEPWWFGSKDDPEQLTSLGRLISGLAGNRCPPVQSLRPSASSSAATTHIQLACRSAKGEDAPVEDSGEHELLEGVSDHWHLHRMVA